jgi:hypothetical protein
MARFAREIFILLLASGLGLMGCAQNGSRDTTGPVYDTTGRPYNQDTAANSVYGDPGNMGANGVDGNNTPYTGTGGATGVGGVGGGR